MRVLFALFLLAHDFYPPECCSGRDCRPVPCEQVSPAGAGYRYAGRYFKPQAVRPSPDGQCHACFSDYLNLCLFIPQLSS
jgi:hypothetical protein